MVVGHSGDASSIFAVGTGSKFVQIMTCVINSLIMGATGTVGHHIREKKPEVVENVVGDIHYHGIRIFLYDLFSVGLS